MRLGIGSHTLSYLCSSEAQRLGRGAEVNRISVGCGRQQKSQSHLYLPTRGTISDPANDWGWIPYALHKVYLCAISHVDTGVPSGEIIH